MARILIIDDSPAVLGEARRLLEAAGHTVATQSTPAGLPAVVKREQPDLILLDVSMPTLDGDQTLLMMRARGALGDAIVLLFSAKSIGELGTIAAACGADGFVSKTEGGPAMVEAVQAHLVKRAQ